ncbi:hypothetical protein [Clostridium thermobutyricum]|uniref:Uncharacterized protein n=1 Tax=Clostridium thermobutyricum DSM 4928 TaxID=1121339 RepID=A0A1V4SSM1_9CLOT|nr:hypothetical protein [Clostridium thermobutyricum]OPX46878.1 hypothetical protein CLTHE_24610 [Clostridium thermobutyricum DSM 4928]
MKKIIIGIIAVLILCIGGLYIRYLYILNTNYKIVASNKVDNINLNTSTNGNNISNINNANTSNLNKGNSETSNNVNNNYTDKQTESTGGVIELVNENQNEKNLRTVIVKNTTGRKISDNELSNYMRYWMSVGQLNCLGVYSYENTLWGKAWINEVSSSDLITAFIQANGEEALKKDITANEFNNAVMRLDNIVESQPIPFTKSQIKEVLANLMEQEYGKDKIAKIVYSNPWYKVYTEPYNKKSTPIYVDMYTGYATGA